MNELWVTYKYLQDKGISINTIDSWIKRGVVVNKKLYGYSSVLYDTIPIETKNKLPRKSQIIKEYEKQKIDESIGLYYKKMIDSKENDFSSYLTLYIDKVTDDKVLEYAEKHAVLACIMSDYERCKRNHERFNLNYYHQALCKIYPDWYVYAAFCTALKKAHNEGIERLLVKKYKPAPTLYNELYVNVVMELMNDKVRYTQPQIAKKLWRWCEQNNLSKPSLAWVKFKCKELSSIVGTRNGNDYPFYHQQPYMGLRKAENANTQWLIDGWDLPFYMENCKRLTLFAVFDAYSGKIVGFHVGKSENTEVILKGIESAMRDTGFMPGEIVSDNHSFNKTKEAENFKDDIACFGIKWNVSQNPRRKARIERFFRELGDNFCKEIPGYLGQGIKSKMKNARPAQELIDEAVKHPLSESQIKIIAASCVEQYNNTKKKDGYSPNDLYDEAVNDESRRKACIPVNEIKLAQLFIRRSEKTVKSGMVIIEREGIKHCFEASAEQYLQLEGKKFGIRYILESDEIYLFDLKTDKYIASLYRQKQAHAAFADQTEDDKMLYYKHKGRLNGISNAIKKERKRIHDKAMEINPEAVYSLNPLLYEKDLIKDFKETAEAAIFAERHGINLDEVPELPKRKKDNNEYKDNVKKRRKDDSPFHHTDEKVDAYSFLRDSD